MPRGLAVHLAAEQAVAGRDARDVGAMGRLDDADVDEVGLPVDPGRREVDVLAVLDDEGIDSAIAVAGLSVPKWPMSNLSL